ncbi:MAG: hypothetical protein M0Z36_13130 [Thermaerobacter sp.]|jgi:hypothetical protein|nr:hypothetical protein [Thermaerobacter sp.]
MRQFKFTDQRSYNDHIDTAIAGPLTTREIAALIRAGERFKQKTLKTQWSIALLRGLGRAPDPAPFSRAYFAGRAAALAEALALAGIEAERGRLAAWEKWDTMMGYANVVENELIDRHNAEACASGDWHAIPR